MAVRRVRITVRGRVQGVAYRASTQRMAERLGLGGWVKNQQDGSVLLEAEGEASQVEQLEAWCKRGPPAAEVSGVEVEEVEAVGSAPGFAVRY
jgi:acylphosphatase